jgi:hypothetical protein
MLVCACDGLWICPELLVLIYINNVLNLRKLTKIAKIMPSLTLGKGGHLAPTYATWTRPNGQFSVSPNMRLTKSPELSAFAVC